MLDLRIQDATKSYRETVAGYDEETVRELAQTLGIDGYETTPLVTLREEIVSSWRDDARADAYQSSQVNDGPGDPDATQDGNPGNDNVTLIDVYDT